MVLKILGKQYILNIRWKANIETKSILNSLKTTKWIRLSSSGVTTGSWVQQVHDMDPCHSELSLYRTNNHYSWLSANYLWESCYKNQGCTFPILIFLDDFSFQKLFYSDTNWFIYLPSQASTCLGLEIMFLGALSSVLFS